eukprot:677385-Rhodomonas_salina.1
MSEVCGRPELLDSVELRPAALVDSVNTRSRVSGTSGVTSCSTLPDVTTYGALDDAKSGEAGPSESDPESSPSIKDLRTIGIKVPSL